MAVAASCDLIWVLFCLLKSNIQSPFDSPNAIMKFLLTLKMFSKSYVTFDCKKIEFTQDSARESVCFNGEFRLTFEMFILSN